MHGRGEVCSCLETFEISFDRYSRTVNDHESLLYRVSNSGSRYKQTLLILFL